MGAAYRRQPGGVTVIALAAFWLPIFLACATMSAAILITAGIEGLCQLIWQEKEGCAVCNQSTPDGLVSSEHVAAGGRDGRGQAEGYAAAGWEMGI